jgi:hypothetical protein
VLHERHKLAILQFSIDNRASVMEAKKGGRTIEPMRIRVLVAKRQLLQHYLPLG